MRTLAATVLLLACSACHADSIARVGADWVRVTALPCKDEAVRAQIVAAGEDPDDYRAASAEFGGQAFSACWRPVLPQRAVWLVYADGDKGIVPFDDLKPVRSI